jgi:hypothetical protein
MYAGVDRIALDEEPSSIGKSRWVHEGCCYRARGVTSPMGEEASRDLDRPTAEDKEAANAVAAGSAAEWNVEKAEKIVSELWQHVRRERIEDDGRRAVRNVRRGELR